MMMMWDYVIVSIDEGDYNFGVDMIFVVWIVSFRDFKDWIMEVGVSMRWNLVFFVWVFVI